MEKEILDDVSSKNRKYSYGQESYWFLLISLFLWFVTSLTIGIMGYLPWSWSIERVIAIFVSLLIFIFSILGIQKGVNSSRIKEAKSREQRLGFIGNILVFMVFLMININNLMDIIVYFK